MLLKNRHVLVGVTGGIAAYKAVHFIRLLRKEGAEVRVVLTEAGEKMVGRATFEAISGYPVLQHAFEMSEGAISHIEAARWADLFVVYPCSANTAAKLAHGLADEMLSLISLATRAPRLLFPSMNEAMWDHPAFQRNLSLLQQDGVKIITPTEGEMACGETGRGRLPEPEEALDWAIDTLAPSPARGKVVIALGRTEEQIDPVRILTNRSSGQTGVALANAYRLDGWEVTLVAGPTDHPLPSWAEIKPVSSAQEMAEAVKAEFERADLLVMVAAVADFRPATKSKEKIKSSREMRSIELLPNPDILAECSRSRKRGQAVIGFALESENVIANAREKLQSKGCDLLVVNNPSTPGGGFGSDRVEWGIIDPSGLLIDLALRPKSELASAVVEESNRLIKKKE